MKHTVLVLKERRRDRRIAKKADALETMEKRLATWQVGAKIGPYLLQEFLQQSWAGPVWQGIETAPKRVVRLQQVRRNDLEWITDQQWKLFEEQAEALPTLAHPHLLPYYESIPLSSNEWCLAMEVPSISTDQSPNFRSWIEQQPMGELEAWQLWLSIVKGLQHLHARGWIHGSLSPEVLTLEWNEEQPNIKIGDLGLFHLTPPPALAPSKDSASQFVAFLAPEAHISQSIKEHPSTDIFALGSLLWFFLTGSAPPPHWAEEARWRERPLFIQEALQKTLAAVPEARETHCRPLLQLAPGEAPTRAATVPHKERTETQAWAETTKPATAPHKERTETQAWAETNSTDEKSLSYPEGGLSKKRSLQRRTQEIVPMPTLEQMFADAENLAATWVEAPISIPVPGPHPGDTLPYVDESLLPERDRSFLKKQDDLEKSLPSMIESKTKVSPRDTMPGFEKRASSWADRSEEVEAAQEPLDSLNLPQATEHLPQATGHLLQATGHLPQATGHLPQATEHLSQATEHLSQTTEHLSQTTEHLSWEDVAPEFPIPKSRPLPDAIPASWELQVLREDQKLYQEANSRRLFWLVLMLFLSLIIYFGLE